MCHGIVGGQVSVCVVCELGYFYFIFFYARAFTPSFTLRKQFQSFISLLIDKKDPHLMSNCKN